MPFRWLEDVAIADIAFEARGETLEELFRQSALALEEAMVDTRMIQAEQIRILNFSDEKLDMLLYDFLSELIFLKDTDGLLFSGFDIKISKEGGTYSLKAEVQGEEIDRKRHDLRNDVKAVTMHLLEVTQDEEGWKATVVLDI
ncbi:MAG: archease [Candidatus Aenigmarchaeota archaeon]|nr:archease [Candidatus Aenigmarchaeota archaeon]